MKVERLFDVTNGYIRVTYFETCFLGQYSKNIFLKLKRLKNDKSPKYKSGL